MTQDFARKKSTPKSAKTAPKKTAKSKRKSNTRAKPDNKKPPLWMWFLATFCVAGFIFFLQTLPKKTIVKPQEKPPKQQAVTTPQKTEQESQIQLDFYKILKEHQVNVDAEPIPDTTQSSNIVRWLQAASFKTYEEANTFRAKLLLLNLEAVIEKTTDKKGTDWYRVLVGPFSSRSKLAKARSILASEQINSFVIKRKISP